MSSDEEFVFFLLGALEHARIEAIFVGTTAAALQGVPLTTQDVDLLIRDTRANRKKISVLARELGASPVAASELSDIVSLIGGSVPVDVVFNFLPGGLTFHQIRKRSIKVRLKNRYASVASLEDIIASKQAAGRPKDQAQLPILQDTLKVKRVLR